MNKLPTCFAAAFFAVNMLATDAAIADVSFYTDRAAWEAAVGGNFHEETFANQSPYWFNFAMPSLQSVENGAMRATAQRFNPDSMGTGPWLQFDSDVRAFGGNWDLRPGLPGVGLEIYFAGKSGWESVGEQIGRSFAGGFFGFVSDRPLGTELFISGGTQGLGRGRESFALDNAVLAAAAVPEPSTCALMLAGLGVVWGFKRRGQVNC